MARKIKMSFPKKKNFWIGFILVLLGVIGLVRWLQVQHISQFDRFITSDVSIYADISVSSSEAKTLQTMFPGTDFGAIADDFFFSRFGVEAEIVQSPWLLENAAFGIFENGDFVFMSQYNRKTEAEAFLQKFFLPNEEIKKEVSLKGEIWSPEFSSSLTVGFVGTNLFVSSSAERVEKLFSSSEKVANLPEYQKSFKDLPQKNLTRVFVRSNGLIPLLKSEKSAALKPIFEAFGTMIPSGGFALYPEEGALRVAAKFLSTPGVYDKDAQHSASKDIIPELASFAPKDVLFFMNGEDLYEKYLHTKTFLSELHPQFSVVFQGLLQSRAREVFGENVDLEKDLLSQIHGQYALIFDIQDTTNPFVDFAFVTGFGGNDTEQNKILLQEVIRNAQGRFAPMIESVELPDGTIREELVARAAKESDIIEQSVQGIDYYSVENRTANYQFSYSFYDGYLVFSTNPKSIQNVLLASSNKLENLTQNEDFRESILFRHSISESYGFVNTQKLGTVFELVQDLQAKESKFGSWLRENIRTMSFARKVFKEEIFWSAILFSR